MRSLTRTLFAMLCCALPASTAFADRHGHCSTHAVAGKWVFATGIGRQALGEPFPPGKDITAIGTMNITRDGRLSGDFDVTVQDAFFGPAIPYSGTIEVNADCTGKLSFVTGAGSMRTDSIVVVSRTEMLGMSRDPANLWTYQVRKIGPARGSSEDGGRDNNTGGD